MMFLYADVMQSYTLFDYVLDLTSLTGLVRQDTRGRSTTSCSYPVNVGCLSKNHSVFLFQG